MSFQQTKSASGTRLGHVLFTGLYSKVTTGNPYIQESSGSQSRAFAEFDITSIPPHAVVRSARVKFTTGSNTDVPVFGSTDFAWRALSVQPTVASASSIYNGITSPNYTATFFLDTAAEAHDIAVNASGVSALNTAIAASQGWFAMGCMITSAIGSPHDADIARNAAVKLTMNLELSRRYDFEGSRVGVLRRRHVFGG